MRLWLNRCILAVAALEFFAIFSGAFLSSSRIALGQPAPVAFVHQAVGIAALLLALGLCLWISRNAAGRNVRAAAWLTFATLAVSSATGWASPLSAARVVCHAVFAHLSIALITAAAVLNSRGWSEPATPADSESWGALRPAALWTPAAVLVQIAMGALYRHQITGVMPHMLGAMVVALLTLVVSVILLQHFQGQRELKSAATALISAVLAQVCLGIAVFIMLLLGVGNNPAFAWLATGHVCVGTLTFAASVVTAMQVRRYLSPAP